MTKIQDFIAQDFFSQRVSISARRSMHIDLETQSFFQTHDVDVSGSSMNSPTESVRQRRINRFNTMKFYRSERRGGQAWQSDAESDIDFFASMDSYFQFKQKIKND